jgi:hypothetical protein
MTSASNAIIPTFGKWMSTKYLWNDQDLIAEKDFDKAFQMINQKYVQDKI